jgi:hypothetical protein
MGRLGFLFPAVLLGLAAAATTSAFVLDRRQTDDTLPYTMARYDEGDVRRAFAAEGVTLTFRSRSDHSEITTLGNARDVLELDVFGKADAVRASGFQDLDRAADCAVEGHLAVRWRGNVRAILNCDLTRHEESWLARINRALAALGANAGGDHDDPPPEPGLARREAHKERTA